MIDQKGRKIFLDNLNAIDKSRRLEAVMENANLVSASSEIMNLSNLVPNNCDQAKVDSVVTYLVSLDYLVKGIYTHWLVKLGEENKNTQATELMNKMDVKYPILIGD